jgi:hypothetical protein
MTTYPEDAVAATEVTSEHTSALAEHYIHAVPTNT